MEKKLLLMFLCCFSLQFIYAQTDDELLKDLEIAFTHYSYPPSNLSTLDLYEVEIRSKSGNYSVGVDKWYGDIQVFGNMNFDNVPKGIYVLKLYLNKKNIETRKIMINTNH